MFWLFQKTASISVVGALLKTPNEHLAMKYKHKYILMSLKSWKPSPNTLTDLKPKWKKKTKNQKKSPRKWITDIVIIATGKYMVLVFKD